MLSYRLLLLSIGASVFSGFCSAQQAPATYVQWVKTGTTSEAPTSVAQTGAAQKLVGGGARANWATQGLLLTSTQPDVPGSNNWVAAAKDHLAAEAGTVTAFAIGLLDTTDDWDVGIFNATGAMSETPVATVSLPAGYTITGGGCTDNWRTSPASMGSLLTASYPLSTTTWQCAGKSHGASSPASVTAFIIGIRPKRAGIPAPQVQITSASSTIAAHPEATAPAIPGFVVTGGGAVATTPNVSDRGQLLTASSPTMAGPLNTVAGWYAASKDHQFSSPGMVQAFAINLRFAATSTTPAPLSGYHIVQGATFRVGGLDFVSRSASCPSGTVATGGGFASGTSQTAQIRGVAPNASGNGIDLFVRNGILTSWSDLVPIAICINPPAGFILNRVDSNAAVTGQAFPLAAACPGKTLIGGGAGSNEATVHLGTNAPRIDGAAWTSLERQDAPFTNSGTYAVAACMDPSVPSPVVVAVSSDLALSPQSTQTLQANCPGGTVALAGGVSDDTAVADVLDSQPLPGGTGWQARVGNPMTFLRPITATLRIRVLCAAVH
jgi:hypothetical protein